MKIAAYKADNYCKKPDPNIAFILLYGPDEGLSKLRLQDLITHYLPHKDPFSYVKLDSQQLEQNKFLIKEEALNIAFGGNRKIIIAEKIHDHASEAIADYLDYDDTQNIIIVVEGNLPPKSSLRKLAEQHKKAASIAGYKDDAEQTQKLISQMIRSHHISLSHDAETYLIHALGDDRQTTMNELEKIRLYAVTKKNIDYNDVLQLVGLNDFDLDGFLQAILNRDIEQFQESFFKIQTESIPPISIIRYALYYVNRLIEAIFIRDKDALSSKQALEKLHPKVFFKNIPSMKHHLEKWNYQQLCDIHHQILMMEQKVKQNGFDPYLILSDGFARIISMQAQNIYEKESL